MTKTYEETRFDWGTVTRRMQAEGCKQRGYAILSISVVVGPDGNPVCWLEPQMKMINPRQGLNAFVSELLAIDNGS